MVYIWCTSTKKKETILYIYFLFMILMFEIPPQKNYSVVYEYHTYVSSLTMNYDYFCDQKTQKKQV